MHRPLWQPFAAAAAVATGCYHASSFLLTSPPALQSSCWCSPHVVFLAARHKAGMSAGHVSAGEGIMVVDMVRTSPSVPYNSSAARAAYSQGPAIQYALHICSLRHRLSKSMDMQAYHLSQALTPYWTLIFVCCGHNSTCIQDCSSLTGGHAHIAGHACAAEHTWSTCAHPDCCSWLRGARSICCPVAQHSCIARCACVL